MLFVFDEEQNISNKSCFARFGFVVAWFESRFCLVTYIVYINSKALKHCGMLSEVRVVPI